MNATGDNVEIVDDIPPPTIDLQKCKVGTETFSNPCFWILLGVIGTIAAQALLTHLDNQRR